MSPWPLRGSWATPYSTFCVRKRRAAVRHLASARSVTVDCEEPIPVQADGDAVAFTPVELKVIPSAVCFIVPEKT